MACPFRYPRPPSRALRTISSGDTSSICVASHQVFPLASQWCEERKIVEPFPCDAYIRNLVGLTTTRCADRARL